MIKLNSEASYKTESAKRRIGKKSRVTESAIYDLKEITGYDAEEIFRDDYYEDLEELWNNAEDIDDFIYDCFSEWLDEDFIYDFLTNRVGINSNGLKDKIHKIYIYWRGDDVNESYKRLHEQDVETDDLALTRREDNYVSELAGLTKYGTSIIALEDEIYRDCADQPERALKLIKALHAKLKNNQDECLDEANVVGMGNLSNLEMYVAKIAARSYISQGYDPDYDLDIITKNLKNEGRSDEYIELVLAKMRDFKNKEFSYRIDYYGSWDNGRVLHSFKKATLDRAEEDAKKASLKDQKNLYYVVLDDIMDPTTGWYYYKGKTYSDSDPELNNIKRTINNIKYENKLRTRRTSLKEQDVEIEVKHEGVLEVPEGKNVDDLPMSHFEKLAKKKGLGKITKALNNLQVWNKKKDPKLSKWAGNMIDKLNKKLKKDESWYERIPLGYKWRNIVIPSDDDFEAEIENYIADLKLADDKIEWDTDYHGGMFGDDRVISLYSSGEDYTDVKYKVEDLRDRYLYDNA